MQAHDDVDIQWTISRRYSEFDTLRGKLCTDGIPARNFPPKVWGSHSDSVLEKRYSCVGLCVSAGGGDVA